MPTDPFDNLLTKDLRELIGLGGVTVRDKMPTDPFYNLQMKDLREVIGFGGVMVRGKISTDQPPDVRF